MAAAPARRSTRKGCPNRAVEFKREIAAAACAPGISVAKLALARGVNTNLLFKWRRQYRAGKFGRPEAQHAVVEADRHELAVAATRPEPALTLLPVEVSAPPGHPITAAACIEVVFRSATVRICGAPELATLRTVLNTLARRA